MTLPAIRLGALGLIALASLPVLAAAPEVTTEPYVARGATFALGRLSYEGSVKKSGFCYSKTNPEPTIEDNVSTRRFNNNGIIHYMTDLESSTFYWVRAFATNSDDETGYGEVVRILTIPKGTITASYNPGSEGTDEINARIQTAIDGALEAWNKATSISGFHATVNYSPGTPTADCSYGGWIRMGANASYQRVGTLLHEMNHGVGVGQHSVWYGPDSPYRESGTTGLWRGKRANAVVKFLENNPDESLHGDNTHMWPYGINGAHEDTGDELLYLANGLITQALGEDALPHVANRFHVGSYNLESVPGEKYYIKTELESNGRNTSFLYETEGNNVVYGPMTPAEAVADDHAAWYVDYDPVECVYTFKNAATGNYLSWKNRVYMCTVDKENFSPKAQYVLTESIKDVNLGEKTLPSYWISVWGDKNHNARSIVIEDGALAAYTYNIQDKGNQRWFIFPQDDMQLFGGSGVGETTVTAPATFPGDVYDIAGRLVRTNAESLDGLQPGIYIVNGRKFRK